MASDMSFVQYAAEQLQGAGEIIYRKMFGEYGLYCDGKFFAVICDNQFFVKITTEAEKAFPRLPKQPPYHGAKAYFLIEDLDNRDFLISLTHITCSALPDTKSKKRGK